MTGNVLYAPVACIPAVFLTAMILLYAFTANKLCPLCCCNLHYVNTFTLLPYFYILRSSPVLSKSVLNHPGNINFPLTVEIFVIVLKNTGSLTRPLHLIRNPSFLTLPVLGVPKQKTRRVLPPCLRGQSFHDYMFKLQINFSVHITSKLSSVRLTSLIF